jgi:MFS family permease
MKKSKRLQYRSQSSTATNNPSILRSIFSATVLVAGLGYFVDIYDLLLFGIVRVESLKGIGLPESEFLNAGILLVNLQMVGMLVGGVVWGVIGDKKGRVSVLFGSILIYSLANIANAFVHSLEFYGLLRFIAGFGLAGELGAAVTLVSESLKKEYRGLGTAVVSSIGISGAICAGVLAEAFGWRASYFIGGVMGLILLVLRLSIFESGMFKEVQRTHVRKGDLRMLFFPMSRFLRYMRCILIGVPIWYAIGILVTFSPELSSLLRVRGVVTAGKSILFCYLGGSLGNLTCGLLSQYLRSRRKAAFVFLIFLLGFSCLLLCSDQLSSTQFYWITIALGFSTGYWVVFMTMAAEQFGTNLRATVTTTVPNFVRGSVVILTFAFQELGHSLGLLESAWRVGLVAVGLAFASVIWMHETFDTELDFLES